VVVVWCHRECFCVWPCFGLAPVRKHSHKSADASSISCVPWRTTFHFTKDTARSVMLTVVVLSSPGRFFKHRTSTRLVAVSCTACSSVLRVRKLTTQKSKAARHFLAQIDLIEFHLSTQHNTKSASAF